MKPNLSGQTPAGCGGRFFLILFMCNAESAQFNRIGSVMTVAEIYTAAAAANLGGAGNFEVDMNNACAGANIVMLNSGTSLYIDIVGFYQVTGSDPGSLHAAFGDLIRFWAGCGQFCLYDRWRGNLQCVVDGTDDAGLSYECGNLGTVSSVYGAWYSFLRTNWGGLLPRAGRRCSPSRGFALHDAPKLLWRFEHPILQQSERVLPGLQLLGTTNDDCGEGPSRE